MTREDITPDVEKRLWKKIKKTDNPKECWEWQGSLVSNGYGRIGVKLPGKGIRNVLATRVAWTLQYGTIGPKLCICHSCDNRACVNIRHLWMGLTSHNTEDMWRKGRNNATTKLQRAQAREEIYKCYQPKYRELMRQEDELKRNKPKTLRAAKQNGHVAQGDNL